MPKSLRKYAEELSNHDWFYAFSDDHRVWSAGNRAEEYLRADMNISPAHKELFQAWCFHISSLSQASPESLGDIQNDFKTSLKTFLDEKEPMK